MSTAGEALFGLFGLGALLSALGTISLRSPIRAAMALLVHIISLSGLFLLLHAHLLAALQVLVYAGAVVVLFVFVIMMIGPTVHEAHAPRGLGAKALSVLTMSAITVLLVGAFASTTKPLPALGNCTPTQGAECDQFGGVFAFANSLFVDSVVPFELISVLLTVAIVGAIAVARGHTLAEKAALSKKLREQKLLATVVDAGADVASIKREPEPSQVPEKKAVAS